ncbi:protein NEGATIVE REGULATOR OF RESISTANCE [Brachypodium distachyon]|uniref:Uncharacterized protein n=1 Tax=Brachypodium distachyon TaxID=15368 RepID=A0A0Q3H0S7_BRADI|nr:protein NEGATIVE REGULATOR OF RESISTANCE [Brachypodium distachyon]KQK16608.1 hypothetical protein BRADI_1g29503v3 [Brachypodium distachyon]|eukprot:XP_014751858.1 protein NEGATIVE REGULATOR OF RESISTANCE [Brachypodium distachyon]
MAANNRKRGADEEAATAEASDAEVEQFYAILGRVRDARRLQHSEAVDRAPAAAPPPPAPAARAPPMTAPWRPSFSLEDFARPPAAARVAAGSGPVPQARGIDLNAEPEPEAPAAAPKRN